MEPADKVLCPLLAYVSYILLVSVESLTFDLAYSAAPAHRTKRPWQGAQETPSKERLPAYDEKCYLCPGNARAGGQLKNEDYESTFVSTRRQFAPSHFAFFSFLSS